MIMVHTSKESLNTGQIGGKVSASGKKSTGSRLFTLTDKQALRSAMVPMEEKGAKAKEQLAKNGQRKQSALLEPVMKAQPESSSLSSNGKTIANY